MAEERINQTVVEGQLLICTIKRYHLPRKGRYGSPKITEELRDRGLKLSKPGIVKMMEHIGISVIVLRIFSTDFTRFSANDPE